MFNLFIDGMIKGALLVDLFLLAACLGKYLGK